MARADADEAGADLVMAVFVELYETFQNRTCPTCDRETADVSKDRVFHCDGNNGLRQGPNRVKCASYWHYHDQLRVFGDRASCSLCTPGTRRPLGFMEDLESNRCPLCWAYSTPAQHHEGTLRCTKGHLWHAHGLLQVLAPRTLVVRAAGNDGPVCRVSECGHVAVRSVRPRVVRAVQGQ